MLKAGCQNILTVLLGSLAVILCVPLTAHAVDKKTCAAQVEIPAAPVEADPYARLRSVGQRVWVTYDRLLQDRVRGQVNPLTHAGVSVNSTGLVYSDFAREIPNLNRYFQVAKQNHISPDQYQALQLEARRTLALILRDRTATPLRLFAALELVQQMTLIFARTHFPSPPNPAKPENKTDSPPEPEQKPNPAQEKKDDVPNWEDMPDTYKPKNQDISSKGDEQTKAVDLIWTTELPHKKLMRDKILDEVTSTHLSASPLQRPTTSEKPTAVIGHSRVNLGEFRSLSIPVQYGFVPVVGNYPGYTVREGYMEEYRLDVQDANLKQVEVPLAKAPARAFKTPNGEGAYMRHSGLNEELWPTQLLDFVNALKSQNFSPQQIAARLEQYFSKDAKFLYFSKGNLINQAELEKLKIELNRLKSIYPEPVAMAHLKSFKCDGAAQIGALILRDFFNLPSRVVGGRTVQGTKTIDGTQYFVSKSTAPRHAWIEVWLGGTWVPFDFTPTLNNPELSNDDKNDLEPIEEERDSTSDSTTKQSNTQGQPTPGKEKQPTDKSQKSNTPSPAEDETNTPPTRGAGSQPLQPRGPLSRLLSQSVGQYLTETLLYNPRSDRKKELTQAAEWVKESGLDAEIQQIFATQYSEAQKLAFTHLGQLGSRELPETMRVVQRNFLTGKMTEAYAELRAIRAGINQLARLRTLTSEEQKFYTGIEALLNRMRTLNHKDAQNHSLVQDLLRNLPGKVSVEYLRNTYGSGIATLGHPDQNNLAAKILQGELKPLILASYLREYAHLVLNGQRIPSFSEQKTSQRAPVMTTHNDLVVARSPLELPRMLLNPRPGEPLFGALIEGRQFALGEREKVKVPDPKIPVERKLTIVYHDISPSMFGVNGEPAEIVDALLLAIVDILLSEVDALNRPTHEVIVVPFNDQLQTSTTITTREAALNYISRRMTLKTVTKGGTNIELVLLDFFNTVADAHKNSLTERSLSRMLRRANLVLLSDGDSPINQANVDAAKARIAAGVAIYFNFVGVGQSNEFLVQLAQASVPPGSKPPYKDLSTEMIAKALNATTVHKDPNAFAANIQTPPEIAAQAMTLINGVPRFSVHHRLDQVRTLAAKIRFVPQAVTSLVNPELITELTSMAYRLKNMSLPSEIRVDFVYKILSNYRQISGRELSNLTHTESLTLNALVEWAAKP